MGTHACFFASSVARLCAMRSLRTFALGLLRTRTGSMASACSPPCSWDMPLHDHPAFRTRLHIAPMQPWELQRSCGGGCDSAGMASNAPVNRYQAIAQQGAIPIQKVAQPTSNVAQFWPNPALAPKSNPSAVTPSKTSRSNAELPVTFR